MQEASSQSRHVDLTTLVPQDSINAAIRIKSLDGFVEIDQLGQGGFGEVWEYRTPIAGTPRAAGKHLKVKLWNLTDKQKADLEKHVNTFVKELNVLYKVSKEYTERFVQFIGCYLDSRKLILFIELMPRGSIADQIFSLKRPLDEATALKYTYQTVQGLNFLHHYHYEEGRIVHRDIKCANLLLTSDYNVKLADFGLAYNLAVDSDSYTMSQNAPCGMAGTLIFAAPEVITGKKYGRRSDIWSLGCTLVEMLTCQPPHTDFWHKHKERAQFLFLEQARANPDKQLQYSGHLLVPHASDSIQKLLDYLLIKNMEHRPRSEDVLSVFTPDPSFPGKVQLDTAKLVELQLRINEKKKKSTHD